MLTPSDSLPYSSSAAAGSSASLATTASAPSVMQEPPYLTHLVRHHGQLTLTSPANLGKQRKPDPQPRPAKTKKPKRNAAVSNEIAAAVANVGLGGSSPASSSGAVSRPSSAPRMSPNDVPMALRPALPLSSLSAPGPSTLRAPSPAPSARSARSAASIEPMPDPTASRPPRARRRAPAATSSEAVPPTIAAPAEPVASISQPDVGPVQGSSRDLVDHEHAVAPSPAEFSSAALRRSIWDDAAIEDPDEPPPPAWSAPVAPRPRSPPPDYVAPPRSPSPPLQTSPPDSPLTGPLADIDADALPERDAEGETLSPAAMAWETDRAAGLDLTRRVKRERDRRRASLMRAARSALLAAQSGQRTAEGEMTVEASGTGDGPTAVTEVDAVELAPTTMARAPTLSGGLFTSRRFGPLTSEPAVGPVVAEPVAEMPSAEPSAAPDRPSTPPPSHALLAVEQVETARAWTPISLSLYREPEPEPPLEPEPLPATSDQPAGPRPASPSPAPMAREGSHIAELTAMLDAALSERDNVPPTPQQSAFPSSAPPPSSDPESSLARRREDGRRHSALLTRPLSIKRKPPPLPAPRRWAAVARAVAETMPEHAVQEVRSNLRPVSSSSSFGAPTPTPSTLAYIPANEAAELPAPLMPSRSSVRDLVGRFDGAVATPTTPPLARRRAPPPPPISPQQPVEVPAVRVESPLRRSGAVRGRPALPPLPDDYVASMPAPSSIRPRGPRPAPILERPEQLVDITPEPSPPASPAMQRSSWSSSSGEAVMASVMEQDEPDEEDEDAPLTNEPAEVNRAPSFYYTDLDLLVSRLDEGNEEGINYDAMLALGEVLGPARSTAATDADFDVLPLAPVELQRRRVDRNGKVKIRLSLAGVRVSKCAICLVQFRAEDLGTIWPECLHCFHADCMRSWLVRGRTCPTCRAPLHPEAPSSAP